MKIEVVEFYFDTMTDANNFKGTMHIYVIDLEMDYRGIRVIRQNGKWVFTEPFQKKQTSNATWIPYPIVRFTSNRKNKSLKKAIETEGKKYIENKIKEEIAI